MNDYWVEVLEEAIGAEAPEIYDLLKGEQLLEIAAWIRGAHENYGLAHGYDVMRGHDDEIAKLKKEIQILRNHDCEWVNNSQTLYMGGGGTSHYYCRTCSRNKTETF